MESERELRKRNAGQLSSYGQPGSEQERRAARARARKALDESFGVQTNGDMVFGSEAQSGPIILD